MTIGDHRNSITEHSAKGRYTHHRVGFSSETVLRESGLAAFLLVIPGHCVTSGIKQKRAQEVQSL
jgi:hypothetical protein